MHGNFSPLIVWKLVWNSHGKSPMNHQWTNLAYLKSEQLPTYNENFSQLDLRIELHWVAPTKTWTTSGAFVNPMSGEQKDIGNSWNPSEIGGSFWRLEPFEDLSMTLPSFDQWWFLHVNPYYESAGELNSHPSRCWNQQKHSSPLNFPPWNYFQFHFGMAHQKKTPHFGPPLPLSPRLPLPLPPDTSTGRHQFALGDAQLIVVAVWGEKSTLQGTMVPSYHWCEAYIIILSQLANLHSRFLEILRFNKNRICEKDSKASRIMLFGICYSTNWSRSLDTTRIPTPSMS